MSERQLRPEGSHLPNYYRLAQDASLHFVSDLERQGFSPDAIKTVLRAIAVSYAPPIAATPEARQAAAGADTAARLHANDWIYEVTSRAEFVLFDRVARNPKFLPSPSLLAARPSHRRPR